METEDVVTSIFISVGIWGGLLVYPVLQYLALKRLRGVWRNLAFVPLVPMVIVLFVTFLSFFQQSNLWPIFLIFVSPFALVYLVVLLASHWFVMRGARK